jgi:hypothetical protein
MFAIPRLRRFKILENRECFAPEKTHLKNFVKLDVSRVTGFPEFPNTSPSGKRVDPTIRFHENQNFGIKRHPRNVGGDTRHPETP